MKKEILDILDSVDFDEVKAELCRRSLFYFVLEFWGTACPDPLQYNWHIKYLCEQLQEIFERWLNGLPAENLLINIAPSSSKSLICSILFPAWCLAVLPTFRIITASGTNKLALDLAVKCRNVMLSDKYKRYFPLTQIKPDEASKGNFKTTLGGGRFSTSVESSVIGQHADMHICDDIIDAEKIKVKEERIQAAEWLYSTLGTRTTDTKKTCRIVIMQRLHWEDPTAHILEREPNIRHICLPSELTGKDDRVKPEHLKQYYINGLFDVVRGDRISLDKKRETLGEYQYQVQCLQNPENEANALVKKEYLPVITQDEFMKVCEGKKVVTNFVCDLALTENSQVNDPSVCIAYCVIDNNVYIKNVYRKFRKFNELIPDMMDFFLKNGIGNQSKVHIEKKVHGQAFIDVLKSGTKYNIIPIPDDYVKGDKEVKLQACVPTLEASRVFLVDGIYTTKFLEELTAVKRKFYDQTDCLVYIINIELFQKKTKPNTIRFR